MAIPAAVLALAASAQATAEAATWFGVRGPHCPLGYLLGECACPGCGLTRSTAMVVQGRFGDALAVNLGGFVVVGLCVGALLLQADVLRRGRVTDGHRSWQAAGRWLFIAGIGTAWAARALGLFAS